MTLIDVVAYQSQAIHNRKYENLNDCLVVFLCTVYVSTCTPEARLQENRSNSDEKEDFREASPL